MGGGMRAAVVGSRGFVGSTVVDELLSRGRHVIAIDRQAARLGSGTRPNSSVEHRVVDILDKGSVVQAIDGVDELYHFAARLGTSELEEDLRSSINTNIIGALNV